MISFLAQGPAAANDLVTILANLGGSGVVAAAVVVAMRFISRANGETRAAERETLTTTLNACREIADTCERTAGIQSSTNITLLQSVQEAREMIRESKELLQQHRDGA